MITPQQIKEKAKRLYPKFVKTWLAGEDDFPYRIPVNLKLPKNFAEAKRAVELLRSSAKTEKSLGYTIQWEARNSRTHGLNQFPIAITVETVEDLLHLSNSSLEFSKLEQSVTLLREHRPDLESWLQESTHWKDLLLSANQLGDLLKMTQYLLENPKPDCFAREIPLPVSTKLIEENQKLLSAWLDRLRPAEQIDFRFSREEFSARYGLKYARLHILLRVLDPHLQQRLGLKFDEISLPAESINELRPEQPIVFIVENKINLLSLPMVKNALAIGGLGRAISLLRDITWLQNSQIYYWGDLDVEGFDMLSQCRDMFEQTHSMLMDRETFISHCELAIAWENNPRMLPIALKPHEQVVYDELLQLKLRLEQERIPQASVLKVIQKLSLEILNHFEVPNQSKNFFE